MSAIKTGIGLIASERQRQLTHEGWDDSHDMEHSESELAVVAALYAVQGVRGVRVLKECTPNGETEEPIYSGIDAWPASWSDEWDRRWTHKKLRRLVIAGALIAAEIDRILNEGGKP